MIRSLILYLSGLDPIFAGLFIVILPSILIMLLTVIVRIYFGYDRLVINNQLAGIKFGILGMSYVMLLTFATISVWEKFSLAQSAVLEEASSARALYIIAKGDMKEQIQVRNSVKNYLYLAIYKGWPLMAVEKDSDETSKALENLYSSAVDLDEVGSSTTQVASELFKHIDKINASKVIRTNLSKGIVPDVLWFILFIGAILTIGFTLFFGGENVFIQTIMTGITSMVMLMALLIIISFDHPFTGEVSISSEPLQSVLNEMP